MNIYFKKMYSTKNFYKNIEKGNIKATEILTYNVCLEINKDLNNTMIISTLK